MSPNIFNFLKEVLKNQPSDWLRLTTHRLDIYNEELAKSEFLVKLDALYANGSVTETELSNFLPTQLNLRDCHATLAMTE